MPKTQTSGPRSTRSTMLGAVLALVIPACSAPSLLITPVSSDRGLVETQLSRDSIFAFTKIALIDVSGVLMDGPKTQLLGEGENPVSLFTEQLDRARRDPFVRGVILRINSPGGTVVAAELMHDEIRHFKKTGKPVIAVMMDVAASGGYYIACACDDIVAQQSTVTGSIGVIMQMYDVSGTMEKIGVKSDAITSGIHKDTGSPFRTMRPEERELFQTIVNEMYDRFVGVVVAGRPKLDEAAVRKLADGRVYTAKQALDAGLIDHIGTIRATVHGLKKRIRAKRVQLVTYHRPADYRPNYYALAPTSAGGDVNLLKIDAAAMFERTTPRFMYLWTPAAR